MIFRHILKNTSATESNSNPARPNEKKDMAVNRSARPKTKQSAFDPKEEKARNTALASHLSHDQLERYEQKIAALESRLKLIDKDIAKVQVSAAEHDAALMNSKLGVEDLRNLEFAKDNHTRVMTLLNELHRSHCSKELVLAETEHEKEQLKNQLLSTQARFAEMESLFRNEVQTAKKTRDAVLQNNQILKKRVLALDAKLAKAVQSQADTALESTILLKDINALRADSEREKHELNSQLSILRTTLSQVESTAKGEQNRLLKKIRDLQAEQAQRRVSDTDSTDDAVPNSVVSECQPLEEDERVTDKVETQDQAVHDAHVLKRLSNGGNDRILTQAASNEPSSAESATEVRVSANDATPSTANSHYRKGVMYIKGQGVEKSETEAIACFEQAAQLGHCFAQLNLGVLLYKGTLEVRDLVASIRWLSEAAAQGHEKALALLPEVEAAYKMESPHDIAI